MRVEVTRQALDMLALVALLGGRRFRTTGEWTEENPWIELPDETVAALLEEQRDDEATLSETIIRLARER